MTDENCNLHAQVKITSTFFKLGLNTPYDDAIEDAHEIDGRI